MGGPGSQPGDKENQTAEQRRQLRQSYNKLTCSVLEGKEVLANVTNNRMAEMLAQVEQLHHKVEKPREHAVDAEVFCHLTACGLDMVNKAHAAGQGKAPADFIIALKSVYVAGAANPIAVGAKNPMAFDWGSLGSHASAPFKGVAGVGAMFGPMDEEAKVRKAPAARRQKRPLGELVNPDDVKVIEESEAQETDRNMEDMWTVLQHIPGKKVPFYNLVCNHGSFSQTVENIFTLSFLVRDQRVRLHSDLDIGTIVAWVPKHQQQQGAGGSDAPAAASQFVISFTTADWDLMKRMAPKEQCVMRHRQLHAAAAPTQQQQQQQQGPSRNSGSNKRRRSA